MIFTRIPSKKLNTSVIVFLCLIVIPIFFVNKAWSSEPEGKVARAEEALSYAEQYVEAHPDDPEALLQLGISYMQLGRHKESIEALEEAEGFAPEDAYIKAWIARAYAEIRNVEKAMEFAQEAIEIEPDDRVLNEFVGGVFFEVGDYERAEEIAYSLTGDDMFYTTRNGSEVVLLFLSRMMLGDESGMNGIIDKLSVVSKKGDDCVKVLIADILMGQGGENVSTAEKLLNEGFGGCGGCGEVEFRRGYFAYLQGYYQEAETDFMDSTTIACSGEEYRPGREQGELLAVMAAFREGTSTGELLDWLYGIEGVDESPYSYWIESLLLYEDGSPDLAPDAILEGTLLLPIDFGIPPGPYSIFSASDYELQEEILNKAAEKLDTFDVPCGGELPVPTGTFFTSTENPDIKNLFRYSSASESAEKCVFQIFSAKTVEINDRLKEKHLILPLSFNEEYYMLKNIYPSEALFETAWYISITDLFPGLVK